MLTFLAHHRRGVVGTVVAGLAGFGITAFGIAPLAPDAALLPQIWVTQEVAVHDLGQQVDALSRQDMQLWRSEISRGNDSAEAMLRRLGVNDALAAIFIRNDPLARKLLQGRGKMLQALAGSDGLVELIARYPVDNAEQAKTHFTRLTVAREGVRWTSRVEIAPFTTQVRMASGSIQTSLFAATDDARLPEAVASQLAELFATDIDFHRELRKGDTFSLLYEGLWADGQAVSWNEGAGRVLAAEFINNGRAFHAVWFDGTSGGRSGYFGLDGSSKRRSFLASPMEFSRVTSGFANRLHPIFQTWRQHLGVDYSAPTGTPVRSVGDGVVDFAGWRNGYGNVIEVRHGNERSTLYAHLSAMQVKVGDRIAQGQHIGAVGTTGWSTGSHLHFEFRVNGVHHDPLSVAKASEPVQIDPAARARFADLAKALQVKLDIAVDKMAGLRIRAE